MSNLAGQRRIRCKTVIDRMDGSNRIVDRVNKLLARFDVQLVQNDELRNRIALDVASPGGQYEASRLPAEVEDYLRLNNPRLQIFMVSQRSRCRGFAGGSSC